MSKLKIISALLGSLGAIIPFSANADLSDLSGVGHEMPASVDETVHLGMPFNAMSGQFQHYRCINGPIVEAVENGNSELVLQQGLTESEIRKYLSGSISAGFNSALLDGVLGAEAGAGLARSLSESETSISYSYGYELEKIVESLVVNSFNSDGLPEHISSECLDLIDLVSDTSQPIDNSTLASMGTHLLTNISYGASLFANLKISARTATEKSEINGMLDISSGILDISGNLDDLSEDTRRNTTVEVYVRQLGGEPRKLLESLSAENGNDGTAVVARCDLNDIGPCRDIFTEIIRYAKNGFQQSLVDAYGYLDASRLARINYYVTPLINYNLSVLTPDELGQHAADESGNLIEILQGYEAYSEKLSLVENAIFYSNDSYTDLYRANLYALRDKISYAKQLLLKASTICREDFISGSNCEMAKDEIYSSSINSNLSVAPIESASFSGLFSSISDMSIEHEAVFDANGAVPGVRFSWAGSNVVSCNVELTNANGEAIISLPNTDVKGEVIVPMAEITEGRDESGNLSLAVAKVECTDLLFSVNIEESESLDVFEGVDFTDLMYLVLVDSDSDHYSLKLENAALTDGDCFVNATFYFVNHNNNTYGTRATDFVKVDKDEPWIDISIADIRYPSGDYYELSFSEIEVPAGYTEHGHKMPLPYQFFCISSKLIDFNPDEYVIMELSYGGDGSLLYCNTSALYHYLTPYSAADQMWTSDLSYYFNDDHKHTFVIDMPDDYHWGLEPRFVTPVSVFISCVPEPGYGQIWFQKTFPQ